jgi:hypothetical protein
MKLFTDNWIEMHCVAEELNNARKLVHLSEVDHSISNECELTDSNYIPLVVFRNIPRTIK